MEPIRRCFLAALALVTAFPLGPQTSGITHRFVQVNGIRMHIAEQGQGPLVLLLHGFPELWYNWRHVMPALAAAGYHAVAPDMRGYGQTDAPPRVEDYSLPQIAGDLVGLVHALGYEQAVVVGHDWGSPAAYYCANLRPDMFRAVGLISVFYSVRLEGALKPTEASQRNTPPGKVFYQAYFQQPGAAEKEFEADPRRALLSFLASLVKPGRNPLFLDVGGKFLDAFEEPKQLHAWLKPEDLDYYVSEFTRTGFRGGLNWYRAVDLDWEQTPFLTGRKLLQPALLIKGANEGMPFDPDILRKSIPNLSKAVELPSVGHWVEQQAPHEVNKLLIEFLRQVDSTEAQSKNAH